MDKKCFGQGYRSTICWGCKHAVPNPEKGIGCSWSTKFKPVKGWKAEKDTITGGSGKNYTLIKTYRVIKCPKFEKG